MMSMLPQVKDYTVVERIGSGSYATVYKAYKKNGPREVVAVKCVDKSKLSGSAVDNLITEITLLKVLKHPHIVEMKDFQWDERYIYIIMEYCGAGDLSAFIRKRHKLPESVCRTFLQQLGLALKFLRSHNVSHMDLKPQNLLLTSNPILTLKLGDFGFAQYLSVDDQNSSMRGSPLYMAPEILFKQKYDARVDLWSVGIIMFECLFGKAPYSSSNFPELAAKIRSKAPIEIPAGSSISPDCRDLLKHLLKHNPDDRIDFELFFQHPFLDLKHAPSLDSYKLGVELVTKAIECDVKKQHIEAFNLYCEALRYFVPLIHAEADSQKKAALRSKTNEYIKRAEDLKNLVFLDSEQELSANQEEQSTSERSSYKTNFNELKHQSRMTPSMHTALEIGLTAEQFISEGKFQLALEQLQCCLGLLVPLLSKEPKGRRRDLLHQQRHFADVNLSSDWLKRNTWHNMSQGCAHYWKMMGCTITLYGLVTHSKITPHNSLFLHPDHWTILYDDASLPNYFSYVHLPQVKMIVGRKCPALATAGRELEDVLRSSRF